MDLLSFLRIVRRHVALVALCAVVGAGLGVASTLFKSDPAPAPKKFYEATQVLTVTRDRSGTPTSGFASLDQITTFVVNGDVPQLVAQRVGGDARTIVDQVTVTSSDFLGTLGINVVSPDEDEALTLASAFGAELVSSLDEQLEAKYDAETKALNDRRNALRERGIELDKQLAGLDPFSTAAEDVRAERDAVNDRLRLTITQLVEHSAEPSPSSPVEALDEPQAFRIDQGEYDALLARGQAGDHVIRLDENGEEQGAASASSGASLNGPLPRGLVGLLLGLFVGLGLALLIDSLDRRIRNRADLEAAFGFPVLAEVPAVDVRADTLQVLSYVAPFSQVAEAYRAVRSALLFELTVTGHLGGEQALTVAGGGSQQATVVMVVSAIAAEGKTTTTANLAVAFAETGASVLVVGGDFRKPKLHRMFGIDDTPGAVFDTGIPGIDLVTSVQVPAGATPAQVVDAQRRLVLALAPHYDVVLIDTAPLLSANDAIDLAPLADLLVIVAKHGVTKTHHARRAAEILARIRRPVGGAVFTATPADHDGYGAYYGEVGPRTTTFSAAIDVEPAATESAAGGSAVTESPVDDPWESGPAGPSTGPSSAGPASPVNGTAGFDVHEHGHATVNGSSLGNGNGHTVNGNGHTANGNGHLPDGVTDVAWGAPIRWQPGGDAGE